ncbi:hypothetical protein RESH_01856 [Rhodopirellula europaea SH398]|uniref:Uncharacterized protein n=2 Tax=Rhodopirellula europaea TaxID=1263866 RepID=M2AA06_9BACT|nr:hypothetical protein RE6C_00244 [Rhodopirellula europaea 6C]EMI27454.1 hypothetical protein RESH_01856 [Rhodopirellula europaea SH398]
MSEGSLVFGAESVQTVLVRVSLSALEILSCSRRSVSERLRGGCVCGVSAGNAAKG